MTVFGLLKKKLGWYGIFSPKSTFSYRKLYESTLKTHLKFNKPILVWAQKLTLLLCLNFNASLLHYSNILGVCLLNSTFLFFLIQYIHRQCLLGKIGQWQGKWNKKKHWRDLPRVNGNASRIPNIQWCQILFLSHKFQIFLIWPVVYLMPLEVQGHAVPHLKALVNGKLESWRLGCGNISRFCYLLFKNLNLVLKMGFAWFVFSTTAHCTFLAWEGYKKS